MNRDISIWTRGVDREQFHPGRRDMDWRRSLGIDDDALVVSFLGRLVMEKGLDLFADAIDALAERKVKYQGAGHRRAAPPGNGSSNGCPRRSSSASKSATSSPARSPAATYC